MIRILWSLLFFFFVLRLTFWMVDALPTTIQIVFAIPVIIFMMFLTLASIAFILQDE